eukprot:TRINITY_DN44575_c0_g1_i1.p1 TRINITY_DN44575_c0_g1~~TRINITY_DN44575_c0_g1_i1.p1  ORF type:complete len:402 (+),score=92.48 TRINITY_DN44575_c0_g1_i1:477-1682(+)
MLPSPNNRLMALEAECKELLREVTEARQELTAASERERKLREVCRRRSASLFRLASHLTLAQVRPQQASVESQIDGLLWGATHPESKSAGTMTEATQELLARQREVALNTDDVQEEVWENPHTSQQPTESSQNAPKSSPAIATNREDLQGSEQPMMHSPAARIAELATGNPALREAVLAKLRSVAQHPVEQRAQCAVGMGYTGRPPVLKARSTVQTAIAQKIAASANEAEHWRKAYRDLSAQLERESAEAQRWREEHRTAAARLEVVGRQVDELGACVQKYAARAEQAEDELKECRRTQDVRNVVIHVGKEDSPELSFRWVDDCKPFSAPVGSMAGMQQLKRSLAGVVTKPAELIVGPPPADWKVLIQLRLRQQEPWEPALLRLSVPSAEGCDFVGLIWPN